MQELALELERLVLRVRRRQKATASVGGGSAQLQGVRDRVLSVRSARAGHREVFAGRDRDGLRGAGE